MLCFSISLVLSAVVPQQPLVARLLWSTPPFCLAVICQIFSCRGLLDSAELPPSTNWAEDQPYQRKQTVLCWVSELNWLWEHTWEREGRKFSFLCGSAELLELLIFWVTSPFYLRSDWGVISFYKGKSLLGVLFKHFEMHSLALGRACTPSKN